MLHIKFYRNTVVNILPADTFPNPREVSKEFLNVVMLHINLKGMKYRIPCKQIFRPYINPRLRVRLKGQTILRVAKLKIKKKGRPT